MAKGRSLITAAEVAAKLGISPQQVGNLIRSGTLPAEKIGRTWFVLPSDLAKVPAERKPGPKPKADARRRPAAE